MYDTERKLEFRDRHESLNCTFHHDNFWYDNIKWAINQIKIDFNKIFKLIKTF